MQTRAIQGPVPRRGIRSRKRSISCRRAPGASKGMSWDGASWADRDGRRAGARMCPSIPRVLQGWQINLSLGFCTGSWERSRLFRLLSQVSAQARHKPASSRTGAGVFPKPFPFPPTFKGRGWMGALGAEPARPSRAGAVHAPATALPKETQTSYPKKALFISNTGSHFCTGPACSGQLSPPHRRAEREPGRAFRAGLRPKPPFPPRVRSTKTWRGLM